MKVRTNKNTNEINDTNLEVMNYLIQKLESRKKKIIKFKNLFRELDSFESFYFHRKEIYILLNDLEEDLKQSSFAIKALVLQNKALLKEINIKINEKKTISNQLNFTLGENQNLKLKLNNINEKIIYTIPFSNNNINNNNLLNVNIDSIKVDDEEEYEEPEIKNLLIKNNNSNNNMNNLEKQNKFEQLYNVKNIMKEMRNNKRDLKKIIEEHFKMQKMS